jgi:hypothetical protein
MSYPSWPQWNVNAAPGGAGNVQRNVQDQNRKNESSPYTFTNGQFHGIKQMISENPTTDQAI